MLHSILLIFLSSNEAVKRSSMDFIYSVIICTRKWKHKILLKTFYNSVLSLSHKFITKSTVIPKQLTASLTCVKSMFRPLSENIF